MIEVLTTWWTSLLTASAAALLVVSFIMRLYEWGVHPLRELSKVLHRPWFERLLLLFFICGMVQYAATKGTGNGSRSSESERRINTVDETEETSLRSGNLQDAGNVTNLCFTGISVSTNGIELSIAWPPNLFASGTTLDFFAKYQNLTNAWQWLTYSQISPSMTNLTVVADWLGDLWCVTNPSAMFFKVQDRATCSNTMADADGDGLPDVYELNNGTNPYVSDYALAPKLTVGSAGDYRTLIAALAASTNYSIVEMSSEAEWLDQKITLPSHPVLITGPQDGYARLYSSANIAMFLLDEGQGNDTLFRNIYVILTARDNFQSAFWVGGNLPWSGIGASPTFENVRVRALYPDVLHYGWHYYRDDDGISQISNCVMNAAGSTSAIGIYSYNGPDVGISECAFVNFPTNEGNYASWIRQGANIVAELPQVDTNLSWAGYSLNGTYSSTADSDGDGITDHDEIYVHDTDPWLPDADGDGMTDAEEIDAGTDPKDLYSFHRRVTVVTTAKDDSSDMTNYVAWGTSPTDWETNDISSCWTLPATNVYNMLSSSGPMYIKSFRDLNRNGRYDSEIDIILIAQVPPLDAISSFTLSFGDVDGDDVSDVTERQDGTDPYDNGSFCLRTTVCCVNTDIANCVTNYLGIEGSSENGRVSFISSGTLTVDTLVTNGICEVSCLRDFNGNGAFDEDVDIRYSRTMTKSDNGKTISITIGDADSDGQPDSSELSHGTNPADARSYCFNLSIVEKGIFSTTNDLTAEILFGTNVVAGPMTMTNRTWDVDVGHLVTSNRETVAAYFWDDANSNGLRDVEECCVRQTFAIRGHDNAMTNTLSFGAFDRDGDEMLDYWELLHDDAGLSPTNAADAFIDADSDGLINLHEFWAHCDPYIPDGSNTALSAAANAIDDLISSVNDVTNFGYYTSVSSQSIIKNQQCWVSSIPLQCQSPYNDTGGKLRSGTLISDRHVIFASHFPISVGENLYFSISEDSVMTNRLIASNRIGTTDIAIGLLENSMMNSGITVARILPDNYAEYIGTGKGLPTIVMTQSDDCFVADMNSLHSVTRSTNTSRCRFCKKMFSGISGDPVFLVLDNQPIILFEIKTYNSGSITNGFWGVVGPSVVEYRLAIQSVMDELSLSHNLPTSSLVYFDFSTYERIDEALYE